MVRNALVLVVVSIVASAGGVACSKQSAGEGVNEALPARAPAGVPEIKLEGTPRAPGAGAALPSADPADTSFRVKVALPAPAAPGAEAIAKVSVTPGPGWKVNLEYPTKLKLTTPDGVATPKAVMEIADVARLDETELAFDVKLVAAKAGTYRVAGELKFAVCTPETCDPKKQAVAIELVAR